MDLFSEDERRVAEAVAGIAFGNPFLPERIALEKQALGLKFVAAGDVIVVRDGASYDELFPNVRELHRLAKALTADARQRLRSGHGVPEHDRSLYEDLVCYVLYNRHLSLVNEPIRKAMGSPRWGGPGEGWPAFRADFDSYFEIPGRTLLTRHRPEHLFAVFFQIARAFHAIFENFVGGSKPTSQLRAAVWQSIFTHDLRRYMRALYHHMVDIPTLITGPSGSGKELVARAVGQSLYTEFNPGKKGFAENRYSALNLSAFAPTLVEAELFGTVRGAFSGATDRAGWLEECGCPGPDRVNAIFLDEIGELDEAIQVKLLRVLQDRSFSRVGETSKVPRKFQGKVIAATNRDLAAAMCAGRFRPDFYYRLCADVIMTPALGDQLADRPEDLPDIVRYIIKRRVLRSESAGSEPLADEEIKSLLDEVVAWIGRHLKGAYPWPGNFRELEQCVRNLMIRNHYQPPGSAEPVAAVEAVEAFLGEVRDGSLTSAGLLGKYYAWVLSRTGTYVAASKQLGVDWRVVRKRIDLNFLQLLSKATGSASPSQSRA
ncbi:MAG TPA: sigma 54-interacting transcriptional regulator [Isosphaeraceae bacterium]|nr:sigma 54-interacting transcriptional regulator [Isosphaeraceae bacterium]